MRFRLQLETAIAALRVQNSIITVCTTDSGEWMHSAAGNTRSALKQLADARKQDEDARQQILQLEKMTAASEVRIQTLESALASSKWQVLWAGTSVPFSGSRDPRTKKNAPYCWALGWKALMHLPAGKVFFRRSAIFLHPSLDIFWYVKSVLDTLIDGEFVKRRDCKTGNPEPSTHSKFQPPRVQPR